MKNKNQGYTLIEVLIAVIILSIGLLGIKGIQTKTQQFNREAYFNTQATFFTHDILERARANPKGLNAGFYNNPSNTEHSTCYSVSGCSTQEMAENDMYEWKQVISNTLPGGNAHICIDSTPDDGEPDAPECDGEGLIYAAKVWWSLMDGTNQRVVITSAL